MGRAVSRTAAAKSEGMGQDRSRRGAERSGMSWEAGCRKMSAKDLLSLWIWSRPWASAEDIPARSTTMAETSVARKGQPLKETSPRGTGITLRAGQPFTLTITLHNLGACPWIPKVGHQLQLSGAAVQLDLPSTWDYDGEWAAPGDTRVITLRGTAPATPGTAVLKATFLTPFRVPDPFVTSETTFTWN